MRADTDDDDVDNPSLRHRGAGRYMRPVIIADADPALRRAIRRALGALARRVLQCDTAIDALVALEAERGTMLVLGPSLSDPSVREVVEIVRASRAWADLCVVCVVAPGDASGLRMLMEVGASACIVAPPGAQGAATFKRLLAEHPEAASTETIADPLAALLAPSLPETLASAVRYAIGVSLGQELTMVETPSDDRSDRIRVAATLAPRGAHGRATWDGETRTLELVASASDLGTFADAREPSTAPLSPRATLEHLASIVTARVVAALADRGLAFTSGTVTEASGEGQRIVSGEVWLASDRGASVGVRTVVRRPLPAVAPSPAPGAGGAPASELPSAPRPRIGLSPAPKALLLGE